MRASFLLLLLLCATMSVFGQSSGEVFAHANELYQQNKFTEARDLYESLLQNGYGGGALYYNLGNAYYKSGKIARAILNYERALKLMPADDDLHHNLQLANLMITDKMEPTPRLFVWDYWDSMKAAFTNEEITWLTYALFVVVIAALIVMVIARTYRTRKMALPGGAVGAFFFVVALTILIARISDVQRDDVAIIVADIVTTKNSPDAKSSDAFVLHGGVKVQIVDRLNEWIKIRLADGKVGWAERMAAETI